LGFHNLMAPALWVVREVALSSSYKDGQLNILFDPVSKEGFGGVLDIIGRNPSVSKSNHIHIDLSIYSLHFKIKFMFGHLLRYEIKVTCGEISLKLRQTNWNVARFNVNVIVDELPSQITYYIFFKN